MSNDSKNEKYKYDVELIENFLNTEEIGDILLINVSLYSANLEKAVPFRDYLMKLFNSGKTKLIVNLSNSEYIDSTFLGSLVFVLKKMNAGNGEMRLVLGKASKASTMFEITNMNKVFKVFESVENAKSSFA
jgi:anti-sigma B factor antagonist